MNVCPFIEAENVSTTGNVKRACEPLEVCPTACYAHRTGQSSQRAIQDAELTELIVAIHAESNGTHGAPRVRAELGRCRSAVFAQAGRPAGVPSGSGGQDTETVAHHHGFRSGRDLARRPGRSGFRL